MNRTLEDRIQATVPEQVTDPDVDRLLQAGRRRRHVKQAAAAGGSVMVAIGVVAALTNLPTGAPTVEPLAPPASQPDAPPAAAEAPAWDPEVVEAAGATPRLLVTEPGWQISFVMFADGIGDEQQINFDNGDQQATLEWTTGNTVDEIVTDLTLEGLTAEQTTVLGHDASLLGLSMPVAEPSPGTVPDETPADEQAYAAVFFDGQFTIELVAQVKARSDFLDLVDSLEQVEAEAWLSALPDEQIPVADREAFVTDVLADVPTPPDFEGEQFTTGPLEHPYFLTARVIGQVSCGWISSWLSARADGDDVAEQAAVDAMAAITESDAVDRMAAQGGFGSAVAQYADAIATDGTVTMGRDLTVEESYRDALGC